MKKILKINKTLILYLKSKFLFIFSQLFDKQNGWDSSTFLETSIFLDYLKN